MYTEHPYKIAIVGGIGSGKSIVSRLFRIMGVPVYNCDTEAKRLMNSDVVLRKALVEAIGTQVYGADGNVDRAFLASYMFGNPGRVALVNSIVHPAVRTHFAAWVAKVGSRIVAVETAILFESGMDADVDAILVVHAPEALRLQRAMKRDGASEQAVRNRMSNQMADDDLFSRASFCVCNDDTVSLIAQVGQIIEALSRKLL